MARSILILLAVCNAAFSQNWDGLEGPLSSAKNLNDFLNHANWVSDYKRELLKYYGPDHFKCESFESLSAKLKDLVRRVPAVGEALWAFEEAKPLTYFEKNKRVAFVKPPRRLHAIWFHTQKNCGKECDEADLTAPERWVLGLKGSELWFVERNDRFEGGALLEAELKKGEESFRLLTSLGSKSITDKKRYAMTAKGDAVESSLWDLFIDGKGKILSQYISTEREGTEGVTRLTRVRPTSQEDRFVGFLSAFTMADGNADKVFSSVPKRCFAKDSAKGLNLVMGLGGINSAGLPAYSPPLEKILLSVGYPEKEGLLGGFAKEDLPKVADVIAKELQSEKDTGMRERAALALRVLDGMMNRAKAREGSVSSGNSSIPSREIAGSSVKRVETQSPKFTASSNRIIEDAYKKGLLDTSPVVKGLSAAGLSDHGIDTPQIKAIIGDTMGMLSSDGAPNGAAGASAAGTGAPNGGAANGGAFPGGLTPGQLGEIVGGAGGGGKPGGQGGGPITTPTVPTSALEEVKKNLKNGNIPAAVDAYFRAKPAEVKKIQALVKDLRPLEKQQAFQTASFGKLEELADNGVCPTPDENEESNGP